MKHLILILLALGLSLGQFFLTGVYGKLVFIPILVGLYTMTHFAKKISRKLDGLE